MKQEDIDQWHAMRAEMLAEHKEYLVGILDELFDKLNAAIKVIAVANIRQIEERENFKNDQLATEIETAYLELHAAEEAALDEYRSSKFAAEFWMFVRVAAERARLKELHELPKRGIAHGIADAMEIENKRAREAAAAAVYEAAKAGGEKGGTKPPDGSDGGGGPK